MIFYALHQIGIEPKRLELIQAACEKLKVKFVALDPESFDFREASPVRGGDIVYRVTRGKLLRNFENYLLVDGAVSFYADAVPKRRDPFVLLKAGILAPKTVYCPVRKRVKLDDYVDYLGGFPVVVKALGGTHGLGVIKVDSYSALYGVVDYLLAQNKVVILREFIPVKSSARLIVLGNKVIGSLEYVSRNRDFRTNVANKLSVSAKKYPKELELLAVKAVKTMGLEFGGVDILINDKKAYVAEVNFPCNFVRAQAALNQDIALEMVKYLVAKARA